MASETWNDLCVKHEYTSGNYQSVCVILAFTKDYMPGAIALVKSLVKNTTKMVTFKVFHRGLDVRDRRKLSLCVKRNFSFFSGDDPALKRISYAWWLQAFHHQFVYRYDYTLYIDVDIIVCKPLDELIQRFDQSSCKISGVNQKEPNRKKFKEQNKEHLINTGWVLFKRSFFNTAEFVKLKETIDKTPFVKNDQPFFRNFLNKEKINVLYAPYAYNANANHSHSHSYILHFVGDTKPWQKRIPGSKRSGADKAAILWEKLVDKL